MISIFILLILLILLLIFFNSQKEYFISKNDKKRRNKYPFDGPDDSDLDEKNNRLDSDQSLLL